MIPTEQLVAALEELPARDRELLELSLCRRMSDQALATRFEVDESELVRRRAGAIERVSGLLDLQRAADLGDVLKALLEPSTWAEVGARPTEGVPAAEIPVLAPSAADTPVPSTADQPDLIPPPAADQPDLTPAPADQPDDAPPAAAEPELLADHPEPADSADEPRPSRRRWLAPVALAAAVLLVLVVAVGALTQSPGTGGEGPQRVFVPSAVGKTRSEKKPAGNVTATVRGRPVLFSRPGGGGRRRMLPARTEFESPRVFGVVRRKGDWLAVQASELENGQVGWLRADGAKLYSSPWSLHADLSRKSIEVRKDGRPVRRFKIAIGSPGHPTPKGRFSVTDKLKVTDPGSPYGCCALALSGHQVDLPSDWPGGDRLAVHATRDVSSIGKPVSLGCMRAQSKQARWLIDTIPLGSPIFVKG